MKLRHWYVTLVAGAILGSAIASHNPWYIAGGLLGVLASFFYPIVDRTAAQQGRLDADRFAHRRRDR
jgi:hypothetical protein